MIRVFCLMLVVASGGIAIPAQTIQRAERGTPLADAKLPYQVRRQIEKVIFPDNVVTDRYDKEDAEEHTHVLRVLVGPKRRMGLRVWGGDLHLCGKSNCSIYLFDPSNGSELFGSDGYELAFRPTVHKGFFDIQTKHQLGAGSTQLDRYQFDGKQYRLVDTQLIGS